MRKYFYLILISLISFQATAATLNEAKSLIAAQNYERAVVVMRSLMRQPAMARNAEANKLFGQCLCMTGQYEESIPYLEKSKKSKTGANYYLGISKQHTYDFDGAVEALEAYREVCTEGSLWQQKTDSVLNECRICQRAVNHVEDVEIIDSLMVPQKNFFAHYKLGAESGHIVTPHDCGMLIEQFSDTASAVFENVPHDYRLITAADPETGTYNLYSSSYFEGIWNAPEKISSVGGENAKVSYPYMRADGETLYFACDSTPGFGGFDIYKTHFNSETDSYYSPDRLGMPFNSPYNDYMMAIDETHQVGWWATDRGAKEGFVCIYLFKLPEEPDYLEGENVSRARIDRIADSWKEENYDELLASINNAPQDGSAAKQKLYIPIRDEVIYTSVDDFKNPKAREAYEASLNAKESYAVNAEDLASLRYKYAIADASHRAQLKSQILQKERIVENLREQILKLEKQYRNLEK